MFSSFILNVINFVGFLGPLLHISVILSSLLGVQKAFSHNEKLRLVHTGAENSDVLSKLLIKNTCREDCPEESMKSKSLQTGTCSLQTKGFGKIPRGGCICSPPKDRAKLSLLQIRVGITHSLPATPTIFRDRMESLTQVKGGLVILLQWTHQAELG